MPLDAQMYPTRRNAEMQIVVALFISLPTCVNGVGFFICDPPNIEHKQPAGPRTDSHTSRLRSHTWSVCGCRLRRAISYCEKCSILEPALRERLCSGYFQVEVFLLNRSEERRVGKEC